MRGKRTYHHVSALRFLCIILVLNIFIALPYPLHAKIFKYTDSKGVVHYSDQPFYNETAIYMEQDAEEIMGLDYINCAKERSFDEIIYKASSIFEIDPALLKAIIKVESDFNPTAVSRAGAKGLMQLMPNTAFDMDVYDPFDPEDNILGGTRYFKYLLKKFSNNLKISLAAYNAGETAVNRTGGIPSYRETREFVKRVIKYYEIYKGLMEKEIQQYSLPKDGIIQFVDENNIIHITNRPGRYLKRVLSYID